MKWIVDYEGRYKIDTDGNVYSYVLLNKKRKAVTKKSQADPKGYQRIALYKDGKRFHTSIHRLLAMAYIPNPHNKPEVNHINGIKSDNRLSNLEWVTAKENIQHAFKTGLNAPYTRTATHNDKTRKGREKLSSEEAIAIKKVLKNKKYGDMEKLAKKYCVSPQVIYKINTGASYRDAI